MRKNLVKLAFIVALVALVGIFVLPGHTAHAANFSGVLDGSEATSMPTYCASQVGNYDLVGPVQFPTGTYDYVDISIGYDIDLELAIYQGSYDPANPYTNLVTVNDGYGSTTGFDDYGTVSLSAGVDYLLVIHSLCGGMSTGTWEFTINITATDADSDGITDASDNCPNNSNADQADMDNDNIGDACDGFNDNDADGVENTVDNCPANANSGQEDVDNDNIGDACDGFNDNDADTVENSVDNCPANANPFQEDVDNDGVGDACDGLNDNDADGIANSADNCVATYNPDQIDADRDGRGDVCDPFQNTDGRLNWQMGDISAVLYPAVDNQGNPAMQVYCVNPDSAGFLAMVVSQAQLPEGPVTDNTLIATSDVCNVEFWALTEGSQYRYQINVGPDVNGTTYEILFNSIGGADMQMRTFNLYDLGD